MNARGANYAIFLGTRYAAVSEKQTRDMAVSQAIKAGMEVLSSDGDEDEEATSSSSYEEEDKNSDSEGGENDDNSGESRSGTSESTSESESSESESEPSEISKNGEGCLVRER